jgi:hypothetical protein
MNRPLILRWFGRNSGRERRRRSWSVFAVVFAVVAVESGNARASVVDLVSPVSIEGRYTAGSASFGPAAFDVTGDLILAQPALACSTLANAADVVGKIAIVDRGTCTFGTKADQVQQAGAAGVIVANNVDGSPPGMALLTTEQFAITIPVVSITRALGSQLKAELAAGRVVVRLLADQSPPVLLLPSTITAEASSPAGAEVTYSAGATDDVDPDPTVTCSPPSGSTFAIGTTAVICTARDAAGNSATDTFLVQVVDTTPPTLSLPGTLMIDATSPAGATVTYSAVSSDLAGLSATACTPGSGSVFPIGTTVAICTATDPAGNSASGTFQVVVKGATGQIDDLGQRVQAVNAKQGVADSLDAKLQNVLAALSSAKAGDKASACNKLDSFINEVRAQTGPGKSLTQADGDQLIAEAQRIKAVIGCA